MLCPYIIGSGGSLMKQATFYLLDNAEPSGALSAHEAVACAVAAERWRAGKRVLIACEPRAGPAAGRSAVAARAA